MDMDPIDLLMSASAVSAAQQTGLVQALLSGPRTAAAYAEELGLDPRAAALVLDVLVTLDLASRENATYDASPAMKARMAPFRQGDSRENRENLLAHTPTFLRTGAPLAHMDGSPAEREASYRGTVSWLAKLLESSARDLASKLPEQPKRVLDVGCGSGVWGLAIAERFPSTHVTGQDFPAVLESFKARAESLNLGDRVATLPGNMHEVDLPENAFDLVVIANVLRLETPERASALLARLAKAVAPGGSLLVVDALAGGTSERERARALYALNLALRTQGGRVHPPSEFTLWLEAAGLGAIESIQIGGHSAPPGAVGALLAKKPA